MRRGRSLAMNWRQIAIGLGRVMQKKPVPLTLPVREKAG
jgi:hypothetical protein